MTTQPLHSRMSREQQIALAVLFAAVLVVVTGIQMGNAIFPSLSRLFDVPISTVTLLVSVWAFTGLVSPLFGPLSDRYGHGTFLLIGVGVFILGNLLCAFAPDFSVLLVIQILVGLGYAIFGFTHAAVIGDVFPYATRARAMGLVRIAVTAATLAGVPLAAAMADAATARAPFAMVGLVGLGVLLIAFALRSRLVGQAKEQAPEVQRSSWRKVVEILQHRSALVCVLVIAGWAMIPTGTFIYLGAWLEQTFQFSETQVGLAFTMIGIGGLVGNMLTAAWADRLGKKRSAVLGLLVLSFAAMLLPRVPELIVVMTLLIVFTAALEFGIASFMTLITELTPSERGTLMSLVALTNGIGTGLVPLVMGPVWDSAGYTMITTVLGVVGLGLAITIGWLVVERAATLPPTLSEETLSAN